MAVRKLISLRVKELFGNKVFEWMIAEMTLMQELKGDLCTGFVDAWKT